jgi:hypothetical protein
MLKALGCWLIMTLVSIAETEPEPKYQNGVNVLSTHDLMAEFVGIRHQPCHFRTSLCPDRCDHACDLAVFKTVGYVSWKKLSKYGEEPQALYHYRVSAAKNGTQMDTNLISTIKALKPGQLVHLQWEHQYLVTAQSSSPDRPITKLELLNEEEAKVLKAKLDSKILFLSR